MYKEMAVGWACARLFRPVWMLPFLFAATVAVAHPQTERYIPIGASPGDSSNLVSGVITNRRGNLIEVDGRSIAISEETPVWIDNSRRGHTARVGDSSECRAGRFVEVRFRRDKDAEGEPAAAWVKVRIE